jgi:hypothetical protein
MSNRYPDLMYDHLELVISNVKAGKKFNKKTYPGEHYDYWKDFCIAESLTRFTDEYKKAYDLTDKGRAVLASRKLKY